MRMGLTSIELSENQIRKYEKEKDMDYERNVTAQAKARFHRKPYYMCDNGPYRIRRGKADD